MKDNALRPEPSHTLRVLRLLMSPLFTGALDSAHRADLAKSGLTGETIRAHRFMSVPPDLLEGVTGAQVHAAYLRATAPKPVPTVDIAHLAAIRASVTDAVEELIDELPRLGRVTFRELTSSLVDRLDIVVRFLAVLELYKQGLIDIEQASSFGEIQVVWTASPDLLGADLAAIDMYEG